MTDVKKVRVGMPKMDMNDTNNQKLIQDWNNHQVYTKGFEFTTQANTAKDFPCILGGSARRLFGLNLFTASGSETLGDIVSLTVNKEKLIDGVVWWAYNPQQNMGNASKPNQFFALPRSLSGSDTTILNWNSTTAHKIYIVFYLADAI